MDEKMTVGQAQKKLIGILLRHVPFGHSGAQDGALALDALTAALAGKDVESLACGHHKSLAIISAETGKFLYCDLCDARSAQRDAEEMEAKYAAQVEALEAEVARLRLFAQDVMDSWPEGDVDGGALQDYAEDRGLLVKVEVNSPCGDKCVCAEYGDFPLTCYRRTPLLTGAPT